MGETVTATLKEKGLSSLHVIVAKLQVPSLAVKGLFWPLFPIFHSIILFYFIFYFSKCLKLSWAKISKAPSQAILRVRRVPSWAPKTFAWEAQGARVRLPLWVYVSPNRQHYSEVL